MSGVRTRLDTALAGRYSVEHELGRGGMATVYLATDLKHNRLVALKVLHPDIAARLGTERFLREIQVAATLNHPHILALHDSGEADGLLFYVMPYVQGESLRQKLHRERELPVDEAIALTRQVAAALDYAHRQQIVHRDIKPENILLHEGEAMVADFGIALAVSAAGGERITETGLSLGTPEYMSPEQATGQRDVDARTDVYALGCVLYEMLAGEPPYTGPTAQAVLAKRVTDPVPSARRLRDTIPPHVDEAIRRALAKVPADRFVTVAEFGAAVLGKERAERGPALRSAAARPREQQIRFCRTPDGVRIAYATVGEGPPLVKASNWLSHLEFDWESPMWRHWWDGLSLHHRLIRYDERGCGLSDWDVDAMSLDAWVADLEAVVEATGLDQFVLLGVSQGGAIATTYAVRHPQKVTRLILHGAYARGRLMRGSEEERERAELNLHLTRHGWGKATPAFRQVFSTVFFPDASPEQFEWFNELARVSATPENAARIQETTHQVDVRDVAPLVTVPTLVLHCTNDAVVPFVEGRLFASLIPGAEFVPLRSNNHIPLEDEPAWQQFLEAVGDFLRAPRTGS